ncbi:bifunctional riboflavin kinase/FAD synthetase [uncultured Fusobacterium sp.]|uniref:bifunctional riboflavin kinase/FAD synthetase n=1 Tax=uncultured Fusobacterium sp. TaxID=159267 RepID=UPI0027DE45C2|nr:bifunctional riboflavin kinase/FAD synthetase [uncultured Fusobacterium sp.]
MKIINDIFDTKEQFHNSYVAIGTFDGIHYGHQQLIEKAVERAKENDGISVVFTFANHPMEIIDASKTPKCINTLEEKKYILENMGVDYLILQPFNKKFADLTAVEFVEILKRDVDSKEIFVGFNFSFGEGGKAKTKDLIKIGDSMGIKVNEIPAVTIDDQIISSTLIRKSIQRGEFERVNKYLGHQFLIIGEVIHGKKIARQLGFPTANIKLSNRLYPPFGIYGAMVKIEGEDIERYGVVNIGVNPTLKPGERSVEVHILDFDGDIYGKKIYVEIMKFMRDEKKFSSVDELKQVIGNDVKNWQNFVKVRKNGYSSKDR